MRSPPAPCRAGSGEPLEGIWHDRTGEYLARMRGEEVNPDDFIQSETLTFEPLPCREHLSPEQYRARIAALVEQIEADAAAAMERTGRKPLGAEAILRQDQTTRPEHLKKSPAPRFQAFTKKIRQDLYQAYPLRPRSSATRPIPTGITPETFSRHPNRWVPVLRSAGGGRSLLFLTERAFSSGKTLLRRALEVVTRTLHQAPSPTGGYLIALRESQASRLFDIWLEPNSEL